MIKVNRYALGFFFMAIVAAVSLFSGCVKKSFYSFGTLPSKMPCMAVLPLTNVYAPEDGDEYMSEFIAMELYRRKLHGTLGPADIDRLFKKAGRKLPKKIDVETARAIGRALQADAIVFGDMFRLLVQDAEAYPGDAKYLLGIDVHVVEVSNGVLIWLHTQREAVNEAQYVATLSKFSSEMVRALGFSGSTTHRWIQKKGCWDEFQITKNLANLENFQVAQKPRKATRKSARRKPTGPEPLIAKLEPRAKQIAQGLWKGKSFSSGDLFEGRKTSLSIKGLASLTDIGQALLALKNFGRFRVDVHTDGTNDSNSDLRICKQQSKKLVAELENRFPALKGKVRAVAKGGTEPILPNINQRSRKKNRRVVFAMEKR